MKQGTTFFRENFNLRHNIIFEGVSNFLFIQDTPWGIPVPDSKEEEEEWEEHGFQLEQGGGKSQGDSKFGWWAWEGSGQRGKSDLELKMQKCIIMLNKFLQLLSIWSNGFENELKRKEFEFIWSIPNLQSRNFSEIEKKIPSEK